jgi:ATP-dependent DNA helicase RecQ
MALIIPFNGKTPTVHPSAFLAPTAVLIGDVTIGAECSIWFGAVLRGETPVQGRIRASKSARASRAKRSGRKAAAAHNIPHDEVLFERLRAVRKALANEAGVPPYVIFPDRTLIEMAAQQPTTENELLSLHGVGATRLARWGGAFLQAIKDNDS